MYQELLEPNLKLNFFIGTGNFKEDDFGNPIESTQDLIVFARVNQDNNPKFYQMPGITITDIVLKGKIVRRCNEAWIPSSLPEGISWEVPAEGELTIGLEKFSGSFRFIPRLQPPFVNLQKRFGQSIRGYLKVASRN